MTGDAGWAGVIANAWLQPPGKPVWIIFSESQSSSLLSMMVEATALLPENRRWQATFSTYCTNLPPDVDCRVRCVVSGSEEARMAIARGLVVDLTKPMPQAVDSPATQSARTGHTIGVESSKTSSQPTDPGAIQGKEIDSEEEYEVAGTALEQEYQLEGLSSIPPSLILPRSNKKKGRSKFATATEPLPKDVRKWKRTAIIWIAATTLLLLLSGGFYLVWQSIQLSKVVEWRKELEPKKRDEQIDEQNLQAEREQPPVANSGEETPKAPPPMQTTPTHLHELPNEVIEIRFDQRQIESWPEKKPIPKDTKVAVVVLEGNNDAVVKMIAGGKWFTFDEVTREICLKENSGFDFESAETKTLEAKFECNGKSKSIQVTVTNVNEPTLTLSIDDNDNQPMESAFVGQTVRVKASDYRNESSPNSIPFFQWQEQTGGKWKDIPNAKSDSYTIAEDCKFSRLKCNASDKAVFDTVSSNIIEIYPIGEVTIVVAELLQVAAHINTSSPRMKIRVAFPDLAPIERGMERRFDFAGYEQKIIVVQPNIFLINFESDLHPTGLLYKFPKNLFRRPVNGQVLEPIEINIYKLIEASTACTFATKQFTDSIRLIEADGDAIVGLKAFFKGMDFPDNINELGEVAAFLDDIEKLRRFQTYFGIHLVGGYDAIMEETKKQRKFLITVDDDQSKRQLTELAEFDALIKRFSSFEKAFPEVLKAKMKTKPTLNPNPLQEIKSLGSGLFESQNKNQSLKMFWIDLIKTSNDLKEVIDSINELEMTLEGESNVKVWTVAKTNGEIASKSKVDEISLPVRFKLRVTPLAGWVVEKSRARKRDSNEGVPNTNGTRKPMKPLPKKVMEIAK